MTLPIEIEDLRVLIKTLAGPLHVALRDAFMCDAVDEPESVFGALVAYYAADEESRAEVRGCFQRMLATEIPDSPLPDDLVKLCRERLMPIVSEHSHIACADLDADDRELLRELGLA